MKKNLILLAFTITSVSSVFSQSSYGLKTGLNICRVTNLSNQKNNAGFFLTFYKDFKISEKFAIQPGISLQRKGYKRVVKDLIAGPNDRKYDFKQTYNYMSVEIPINAIYFIPTESGEFYLSAGPYVGYITSGKELGTNLEKIGNKENFRNIKFGGDNKEMNRFDAGLNFEVGYRFIGGLTLHAGYGLGFTNLNANKEVKSFSNRLFNIGIGLAISE